MSVLKSDNLYNNIAHTIINAYDCYDTWCNNIEINRIIAFNNDKLSYITDDKQRKSCALGITISLYNAITPTEQNNL
jgi:hypothetical protein